MKPHTFIFESYDFDAATKILTLRYAYDNGLAFSETYKFDFPFVDFDPVLLDRACAQLFLIAGVSYYKAYLPPQVTVKPPCIDNKTAAFLGEIYQKGLGELFYVNNLDPRQNITFPTNIDGYDNLAAINTASDGYLIGIGGGKDSLVAAEVLRDHPDAATWSLNHRKLLEPLVKAIGLPHYYVDRNVDMSIKDLPESYNGHVPISAIIAATGIITAILTGKRDVVVANEFSANEPTLEYQGTTINHQYSKTSEFELLYQKLLLDTFEKNVRYYSILRPLSEFYIAEIFSRYFAKYDTVFSSCNKAFVHGNTTLSWCGECPKCAFVFLILACSLPMQNLKNIFNKNLFTEPGMVPLYRQLLGIAGPKPLDCIGEVRESRFAMQTCIANGLVTPNTYEFEPVTDYDPRQLYPHHMPDEEYRQLIRTINDIQ